MAIPLWRQYTRLTPEQRREILERRRRRLDEASTREEIVEAFEQDAREVREAYQDEVGGGAPAERTPTDAVQEFQNERFGGFSGTESQQIGEAQNFTSQAQVNTFVEGVQSFLQNRANRRWEALPENARGARPTVSISDARDAALNPSEAGLPPNIVQVIGQEARNAN